MKPVTIRLSEELYNDVEKSCKENKRSINAEINYRLEALYNQSKAKKDGNK